jgi:hypothetical protein
VQANSKWPKTETVKIGQCLEDSYNHCPHRQTMLAHTDKQTPPLLLLYIRFHDFANNNQERIHEGFMNLWTTARRE